MATHSYIRPSGVWNPNQLVTHGEFAALDFGQFDSISCSGGTYAPASVITVGGDGMTLTLVGVNTLPSGQLNVSGTAEINAVGTSTVSIGATASFSGVAGANGNWAGIFEFASGSNVGFAGTTGFSGVTTFDAAVTVSATGSMSFNSSASLTVACPSTFSGLPTFSGGASFTAAATVSANWAFLSGITSFAGTNHISGPTILTAIVASSGAGRVQKRLTYVATTGTNSSAYGPENTDVVYVAALTADVTFTIDGTNVGDGDEIRFVNKSTTHLLTINDPSTGTLIALKYGATGQSFSALFVFSLTAGSFLPISFDNQP